jgi:hypothetical protein
MDIPCFVNCTGAKQSIKKMNECSQLPVVKEDIDGCKSLRSRSVGLLYCQWPLTNNYFQGFLRSQGGLSKSQAGAAFMCLEQRFK